MWDVDVFVSIFYEEWLLEGYVECRKIFSAKKRRHSVCVCGAVHGSLWCFWVCFCGFWVRFYVVCGAVLHGLWCALAMLRRVFVCQVAVSCGIVDCVVGLVWCLSLVLSGSDLLSLRI
jgi:hypothetical protein